MSKIFEFFKSHWKTIKIVCFCTLIMYSGICTYVIFSKSATVSRTESDLKSARTELDKLAKDVGIAQSDYSSVADGIKNIEGTVSKLKSTNSELITDQQRLTESAASSADSLRTKNKQLTEQLGSANETIKLLTGNVTELRSTNSKLTADNQRLEKQFTETAGQLQQYTNGITSSSDKIDSGLNDLSNGLDKDNRTISESLKLIQQLRDGYKGTSEGK